MTPDKSNRDALIEQLDKAHDEICAAVKRQMSGDRYVLKITIPANESTDSDLVIGSALRNAITYLNALVAYIEGLERSLLCPETGWTWEKHFKMLCAEMPDDPDGGEWVTEAKREERVAALEAENAQLRAACGEAYDYFHWDEASEPEEVVILDKLKTASGRG